MLTGMLIGALAGVAIAVAVAVLVPRIAALLGLVRAREYVLAMNEPVLVVAPDGSVLEANAAAATLLGEPQLRGRALLSACPQLEVARRAARTKGSRLALDGDLAGFEVSVGQLRGSRGRSRGSVLVVHDERRDREVARRLQEDASRDVLTGIANRRGFEVVFAAALAQRGESAVGVAFIDLDGFKGINDTLGHAAGDTVLTTVARRLEGVLREGDVVARMGGDEFAVLLPGITPSGLAGVRARVTTALERAITAEGTQVVVGASIGVASAPRDGTTIEALLEAADERMYRQKQGKIGRDPRLTAETVAAPVTGPA